MTAPALSFNAISKRYPGVQALSDVLFAVRAGSVHALLGENGAGKSTILRILSGATRPTSGDLTIAGARRVFRSTREAHEAGVAVIHQELNLVPEMTVADNVLLGNMPRRAGFIDPAAIRARAAAQLAALDPRIDPDALVKQLSMGQRQMVEIAKALLRDAQVIAFDEPTSSLSEQETRRLFAVIRELRDRGRVIIYISHRMEEIFALADAITVLRDGRVVARHEGLADVSTEVLVREMVGRAIANVHSYTPRPRGAAVLEVEGLLGRGLRRPVSFSVAGGEIAGFFGLVGAGRSELLKLIYHAERPVAGAVHVGGKPLRAGGPADAIEQGVVLCPEDRKGEGIIATRSVAENINLSARRRRGFFTREAEERANAARFIRELRIKTPSADAPIVELSGGNQQKAILARWLSERVRVLLMDEPTRGVDVGAKSDIYAILFELARAGAAVVLVSSDLPEVLGICDRIMVMREGELVGALPREQATAEAVLRMALPSGPSLAARGGGAQAGPREAHTT